MRVCRAAATQEPLLEPEASWTTHRRMRVIINVTNRMLGGLRLDRIRLRRPWFGRLERAVPVAWADAGTDRRRNLELRHALGPAESSGGDGGDTRSGELVEVVVTMPRVRFGDTVVVVLDGHETEARKRRRRWRLSLRPVNARPVR